LRRARLAAPGGIIVPHRAKSLLAFEHVRGLEANAEAIEKTRDFRVADVHRMAGHQGVWHQRAKGLQFVVYAGFPGGVERGIIAFDLRGRGTLVRGSVADVTVFDPKKKWTFDRTKSLSKSKNTPFDGWQMTGKVVATIVGGKMAYCR